MRADDRLAQVNRRRADLIEKDEEGGLSALEAEELDRLEREARELVAARAGRVAP